VRDLCPFQVAHDLSGRVGALRERFRREPAKRSRSRRNGRGIDLSRDPVANLAFGQRKFITGLQIEPEPGAGAEIAAKAQRGIGGNSALAIEDVRDAP